MDLLLLVLVSFFGALFSAQLLQYVLRRGTQHKINAESIHSQCFWVIENPLPKQKCAQQLFVFVLSPDKAALVKNAIDKNTLLFSETNNLQLKCINKECGETNVFESISLHSKAQYFINAFFTAIGLNGVNKSFGALVDDAIGRKGKAKLKIDSWESNKTGDDGKPIIYSSNKIDKYLKCESNAPTGKDNSDDVDGEDCPF